MHIKTLSDIQSGYRLSEQPVQAPNVVMKYGHHYLGVLTKFGYFRTWERDEVKRALKFLDIIYGWCLMSLILLCIYS